MTLFQGPETSSQPSLGTRPEVYFSTPPTPNVDVGGAIGGTQRGAGRVGGTYKAGEGTTWVGWEAYQGGIHPPGSPILA